MKSLKHIAVIGTGTIGMMLGGLLANAGYDITVISMFRKDVVNTIRQQGITIQQGDQTISTSVRGIFIDEIFPEERFDLMFVTIRSNETESVMKTVKPYLAQNGIVCFLQNGLNDETIGRIIGRNSVIPCICFTGGQSRQTGYIITHDGYFIIGEIDGNISERIKELANILSCVKRVEISDNIMAARWRKMAEVCLTVPVACVSGYSLFSHFDDSLVQRVFGKLAVEVLNVQSVCGFPHGYIMGLSADEWNQLADRDVPELQNKFLAATEAKRQKKSDDSGTGKLTLTDAYTGDIKKGRELEIGYINGYVIRKGEENELRMPYNKKIMSMVLEISDGTRLAERNNLVELCELT